MANILIDLERTKYPHSGVGFFCSCLEKGLRELADAEGVAQRISYYSPKGRGVGDEYLRHRSWHRLYNPTAGGQDVVHITHQLQTYFLRASAKPRYILTLHDLNFVYESLSPRQRARRLAVVRSNLAKADAIVCISDFVRRSLMEHIDLFNLKPDVRITTIHNGLVFDAVLPQAPRQLALPDGAEYLLSIGVLQDKKRQSLLIEMLAHLPKHIHLVLVYSSSHPAYMDRLQALLGRHHLSERVHFLPNVSEAEKLYLLEHCSAYLHPSIAEGFGIPPIEAMYAGRPTFLSPCTSLPEIGGSEAYYFTSEDPEAMATTLLGGLADYHADADKPRRLRAWASRYDYRAMAQAYLRLYEEV